MNLPAPFIEQMRGILGADLEAFLEALQAPAPVSIHLNPLKKSTANTGLAQVVWYDEGYYLPERPVFTLDPLFHAGAYYVQEASSMLIAEAVRQLMPADQPLRVLDLCAAPGGKSTLLASILPKGSLLLSNEVIRNRHQTLQYNMAKWGFSSTHICQHDSRDFKALQGWFDLVLVDAPCSGEGLFRKDPDAAKEWSPAHVEHCSARQRRILAEAAALVRPGGALIYCTCTYNDFENEGNATWLLEQEDFQAAALALPADWGLTAKGLGYQCYPHRVRGEGFYLCCFRRESAVVKVAKTQTSNALKPAGKAEVQALSAWVREDAGLSFFQNHRGEYYALPEDQVADCAHLASALRQASFGTTLGVFKGKDFLPSGELALSLIAHPQLPRHTLERQDALLFLKKEPPHITPVPQGWLLLQYEGLNLGWAKGIQHRINNYYPKEWRILMQVK